MSTSTFKKTWEGITVSSKDEALSPTLIHAMWELALENDNPHELRSLIQNELYPAPEYTNALCLEAYIKRKNKVFQFLIKSSDFQEKMRHACLVRFKADSEKFVQNLVAGDLPMRDFKRLNQLLPYLCGENPVVDNQGNNFILALSKRYMYYFRYPTWKEWLAQEEVLPHLSVVNKRGLDFFKMCRRQTVSKAEKAMYDALCQDLEALLCAKTMSTTLPKATTPKLSTRL